MGLSLKDLWLRVGILLGLGLVSGQKKGDFANSV